MVPGRFHIWPRTASLTSIMASEVTQIVAPFCPPGRLFKSDSNNGPSPGHLNLACVRWSYICSCLLLMVSWQVPYLAKGCRPDFNNGLRGDSNSGPFLPRRLFKSNSNNGPSPGHLNLELHLFISHAYGNNGLRGDSNSGPILVPQRLFESGSNNGPSPGHLNLVSEL